MGNKIEHVEFVSTNLGESEAFFNKVFGWNFQNMDENYSLFQTGEEGGLRGGGFGRETSGEKQQAIAYVTVDDIDAKLKDIEAAGGKTTMPKMALPENYGHIALFSDPHGVAWGLWSK